MRKHLYLVVEDDNYPDREGGVQILDSRLTPSSKNEQTVHHMRNFETGEEWTKTLVSMGYVDFADEDEYEDNIGDAIKRKLAEIDEQHLRDAGLDPETATATDGGGEA